ncbi:unnamed protein product [Parnassius apollo]|uniref:(apollo) hypothetical protein n=1 Tax=Parnassius apollo TaxID=110799 RepID=A0A8S3W9I6_PARAO|nr:unnamed protein product [Parnassius apollo]
MYVSAEHRVAAWCSVAAQLVQHGHRVDAQPAALARAAARAADRRRAGMCPQNIELQHGVVWLHNLCNMAIVWTPNLLRSPAPQHALQGVAVQVCVRRT